MNYRSGLLLALISLVWFSIGWIAHSLSFDPHLQLIIKAYRALQREGIYADEGRLAETAVKSMITSTNDRFAATMQGMISQRYQQDFAGETGVTGVFAEKVGDNIVAQAILPNSEAEKVGLQPGDILLSVDGYPFDATSTDTDAGLLLRGPIGQAAEIVVARQGQQLTFHPVRQRRDAVANAALLPNQVAYFAQHSFALNTPEAVAATLTSLLAQNPQGLIWDLRANGGGSMEVAQAILSLFVEDETLFWARLKNGRLQPFPAQGNPIVPNIPIVILISDHTYSAAETAAISLKELRQATLIGTPTYGKGTIQATIPLQPTFLIHFTIAEWLSPSGHSINGSGITPDILIADNVETAADEPLEQALTLLNQ